LVGLRNSKQLWQANDEIKQELDEKQTRERWYVHKCKTYINWFQQNFVATHHGNNQKYHGNKTNALHFL
jgi:hypothetical protein